MDSENPIQNEHPRDRAAALADEVRRLEHGQSRARGREGEGGGMCW